MNWEAVLGAGALLPLWNAGIRLALPTGLAAVGEAFCERAGVLNLSLEGLMLTGALASFLVAFYSGDPWMGVLAGMGAGLVLAALMALLSVTLKTDQVINGIAIVLLGQGVTSLVYQQLFGVTSTPPRLEPLPVVEVPVASSIPVLGRLLFAQNLLVYASVAVALAVWWVLFRSRLGLAVRAVGERPAAADAAAVRVDLVRWVAVLVSGAMTGLGGAVLVVGQLSLFLPNVTAGRGWVAIALVIFGRWNPLYVLGGAVLFGLTDALQLRIQAASGGIDTGVPFELFQALPYAVTLAVMALVVIRGRRDAQPAALGIPYRKEVRE
jgi:ABC-type uncharacterized transport system permease subunit